MCKIIAIANQKGGVGKTTTTSNLGIGLAKQGKRVLLIDADAQGSLTASLGFTEPDKLEKTLATVMANIINDEDMEDDYGILKHEEGIDLMPGNIELSGLEVSLVNVMSRELVMRSYIEKVKDRYDYILIDCMPSLGMITINAFASADSILIPVQAAYLPVKGLEQLIKTIGKVKRQINPKLEIEGILLTMVDNRTNYAKDISNLLIENYGSRVRIFENSIPMSVRAAEISAEGVSIYQHDPNGKVASAYQSLTVLLDLCNVQAEGDVVVHVQMREQRVALEDRVDLALIGGQIVDPFAVEQHVAGRRGQKTADDPEHGRLSAAAGPQQCEEFLVVDVQVDVVENRLSVLECHSEIREANELFGHVSSPISKKIRMRRKLTKTPETYWIEYIRQG